MRHQPSTIGALPVAVAQAEGIMVGYLPGLAMRRIADLHAGIPILARPQFAQHGPSERPTCAQQ